MKSQMKFLFTLICTCGLISTAKAESPVTEPSPENRGVNISFFGGITGFDQSAYKALKAAMASLIVEGVVDHYVTTSWGLEGGTSFCVQLSKDPKVKLEQITHMLRAIKPADQSVYKFSAVPYCVKED